MSFLQALEVLFSVAGHFDQLEFLDLGSGFKVPYKDEDRETDIVSLGQKLNVAM